MASILVVDDDKAVQEMLKDLLVRHNYEVHTCRDGKQVMPELAKHHYDLLILDVLIPHMNGFVLMEQIRSDIMLRDLPVIMISGIYRSRNHRADMTTRYNVIDYLDKPLSTDRLLDLVGRVVSAASDPAPTTSARPTEKKPGAADFDEALAELLPEIRSQPEPVPLTKPKSEPVTLVKPKSKEPAEEPKRLIVPAKPIRVSAKLVDTSAKHERKEVESAAKHSFKKDAFAAQGSIGKVSVPAVLGSFWHQRASGGLLLRREEIKKIVYLKDGNPFHIKSNLVSECLGQILLKERLINKEQCEQSVETMKKTGQRQGEILVQMGALTPKNLSFALELQLETKLFETFTWTSGEYRFNAGMDLPPANNELSWTGPAVVVDGIRRAFDDRRLTALLKDIMAERLKFSDENLDAVAGAFSEKEQQAIAALHLPRTTEQLLNKIGLTTADATRLIYSLWALEIVQPEE